MFENYVDWNSALLRVWLQDRCGNCIKYGERGSCPREHPQRVSWPSPADSPCHKFYSTHDRNKIEKALTIRALQGDL